MTKKIDDLIDGYLKEDYDFGFSTVSEKEYNETISVAEEKTSSFVGDKKRLEEIIVPLIINLIKTSDQEYIYWPNRADELKPKLKEILSLLRKD